MITKERGAKEKVRFSEDHSEKLGGEGARVLYGGG